MFCIYLCMHLDVMLQQIFIMNSTTYGCSKMFSSKNISDVLVYDFTSKCLLWLKWNVHYGFTKDEALCSFHWHTLGYCHLYFKLIYEWYSCMDSNWKLWNHHHLDTYQRDRAALVKYSRKYSHNNNSHIYSVLSKELKHWNKSCSLISKTTYYCNWRIYEVIDVFMKSKCKSYR